MIQSVLFRFHNICQRTDKCNKNLVRIGRPYIYSHSDDLWILNFPTKKHWRNKSEIEWIEAGLKYFSKNHSKVEIKSVIN